MDLFGIIKFCLLFRVVMSESRKVPMQSRIYPGNVATDAEFPYVGYLSYGGVYECAGSIIHPRWALTAAHCIQDLKDPLFTVGTIHLYGSDGISYNIESFAIHNNFGLQVRGIAPYTKRKTIATYDIGLLRLASDIEFNDNVYWIPLARDSSTYYDYEMAFMVGWGWSQYGETLSSVLLYEYVPMMTIKECDALFKTWYLSEELHVCASNAQRQQACPADSGGPLVLNGDQIGIASGANSDCKGLKPTIYTKVSTFVPWIKSVLAEYNDTI